MDYRRFGDTVVLRLDKGDEIIESLKAVAVKENISAASVSGIGATDDFSVGVFDVPGQVYNRFDYSGTHEITGLAGNISTMSGEVYIHLHMTCAGTDGKVVGGHLIRGVVSLTAEIFVSFADAVLDRKKNSEIGINTFVF